MSAVPPGEQRSGPTEESHLATLQTLTAQLARVTTTADMARLVLDEGVRRLRASTASLMLVVGDSLELTAAFGYPESVLEAYHRIPIDQQTPAGLVVEHRRAVYCRSLEELYEAFPRFRQGPIVGDESFVVLPLESSDLRVLGAMVFGFATRQPFALDERELLEALALEAGAALERARALEELVEARAAAETAREQLAFLAEASARLAASLSLEDTLRTVGELAVPRVADRCVLYLTTGSGQLEKHALAPELTADESVLLKMTRLSIEDRTGPAAVIRSGRAEFVPEVSDEVLAARATSLEQLELLRRVGVGGAFFAPLRARGAPIGALGFLNRSGRRFSPDERALAEELAARAAVAIDNARLFEQELRIAETLQLALLPDRLPDVEGLGLASRYLSGTRGLDVGGDWYDVIPLGDRRIAFVVGDVSGHGVQAARQMAGLRHAIRAYALEGHGPHEVLAGLGRLLNVRRDGHFATILCGIADVARHELALANAGHLEPLLLAGPRSRYLALPSGPPIGVVEGFAYQLTRVPMPAGATFLAFTDGLVERRSEHLDVGLERLRLASERGGELDLDLLLDAVVSALIPEGSDDDAALLALRLEDVAVAAASTH